MAIDLFVKQVACVAVLVLTKGQGRLKSEMDKKCLNYWPDCTLHRQ